MKQKLLLFILKFLVLSLFLSALWFWKGEYYYFLFFTSIATLTLEPSGTDLILPQLAALFYNFIPFISLLLITHGIRIQELVKKLFLGLFLIFLWQIIVTELLFLIYTQVQDPSSPAFGIYFVLTLLNYCIPFVLWLVLARGNIYTWFVSKKRNI